MIAWNWPTRKGENNGESGISGIGRTGEKGYFQPTFSLQKKVDLYVGLLFFYFPRKKGGWKWGGEWWKIRFATPPPFAFHLGWDGCCGVEEPYFTSPPSPFASILPPFPVRYFLIQRGEFLAEKQKRKRETRLRGILQHLGAFPPVSLTCHAVATFARVCNRHVFPIFHGREMEFFFCENIWVIWSYFCLSSSSVAFNSHKTSCSAKKKIRKPSFHLPLSLPYFNSFCCRFFAGERERERGEMFFLLPPPPSLLKFLSLCDVGDCSVCLH